MRFKFIERDKAFNFLKLVIGLSSFLYLSLTNQIDFQAVSEVVLKPSSLFPSLIVLFGITGVMVARWHLLVQEANITSTFGSLFNMTMIGQFFGTILFGSVGSDVIRGCYLLYNQESKKLQAVITIFWDRGIGFALTLFFGALSIQLLPDEIAIKKEIQLLSRFSWAFFVFLAVGVLVLYTKVLKKMKFPQFAKKYEKHWLLLVSYQPSVKTMLLATIFSGIGVFLSVLLAVVCGHALGIEMSFESYLMIVPLGVIASALPLSPLGIGVGQLAYLNLFTWVGSVNASDGATLCTLMQCYHLLINAAGGIFYLYSPKKNEL